MPASPDADRQHLNAYARKVAAEVNRAGLARDVLTLSREDWTEKRSGLFGRTRTKELRTTQTTEEPGWKLLSDFYARLEEWRSVGYGSQSRRGDKSHDLITDIEVWLNPSGELRTYNVTHETVLAAPSPRHLDYLARDLSSGPSTDSDLLWFDYSHGRHTRSFTPQDLVRETAATTTGVRRYPHPFQGVSVALTNLRKRAGTYVPPRGKQ